MSWIFTAEDRRDMREAVDGIGFGGEALAYFLEDRFPSVRRPEPRIRYEPPRRETDWR